MIRSRLSPLVVSWQIASGRETEDVVPWREMKMMMMMRKKGNRRSPAAVVGKEVPLPQDMMGKRGQ